MGEFPEAAFVLGGDPTSIRASGTVWQTFGAAAGDTGTDLRHLDSGEFDGDEADTFRAQVNQDLPPYLDTTGQAWTLVAAALTNYADALDQLQTEISGLRSTGWHQWQSADTAQANARQAASDDAAHTADRTAQADALPAGHTLPADTYRPAAADAHAAADRTAADLQTTVDAAAGVRTRNTHAVDQCIATIDQARRMRFQDPPGWLGALWDDVCGWVADHIDILQALSAVLKKISGIAGMLALIPILAPLAGPVALAAGGLAAGIDAGIKITTGEGDWTQIGLDMAACIPGAKMATAVTAATTTRDIAAGNFHLTDVMAAAAFGAAGRHLPRPAKHRATDQGRPGGKAKSEEDTRVDDWPPPEPTHDPLHAGLQRKRAALPADQQFLLDYNPGLPGIPPGWAPRVAAYKKGWIWQAPGHASDTPLDTLRIMGPTDRHPGGYVRFTDSSGRYLGADGKPSDNGDLTHFDRDERGLYLPPKGWHGNADDKPEADHQD